MARTPRKAHRTSGTVESSVTACTRCSPCVECVIDPTAPVLEPTNDATANRHPRRSEALGQGLSHAAEYVFAGGSMQTKRTTLAQHNIDLSLESRCLYSSRDNDFAACSRHA